MRKIVEEIEGEGLEKLLGQRVLLLCGCYFYHGLLKGINTTCVLLEDASIVYETGAWSPVMTSYKDAQRLPGKEWYVQVEAIESFGVGV